MQFTVKTNELKALLITSSKKDIRAYLNGIYFESTDRGIVAVSTDGHRLLALQVLNDEGRQDLSVIIPREAIEKAVKTKAVSVIVTLDADRFTLDDGTQSIGGLVCDGRFPDWRRVIPTSVSGEASSFQNEYLADFDKIARLLCGGNCKVMQNGTSGALVRFATDQAVGVVMPLRTQEYDPAPPAFIQAAKTESTKQAA